MASLDSGNPTSTASVVTPTTPVVPTTPTTPIDGAVTVSQTDATVLGAENSVNVVNGNLVDNDTTETGKSIQTIVSGPMSFDFNVNVEAAGKYSVTFRTNCTPSGSDLSLSAGGADPAFNDITREIDLKAGAQVLTVFAAPGEASILKVNNITITLVN